MKCYWKYDNIAETQRQYRMLFQADPRMWFTTSGMKNMPEKDVTV